MVLHNSLHGVLNNILLLVRSIRLRSAVIGEYLDLMRFTCYVVSYIFSLTSSRLFGMALENW